MYLPTHYYVYAYLRTSDLTPYYIGKGQGDRAWVEHRNIKEGKGVWTPKDKLRIIIIEQNLSNVGACAIERRLIRWYGRKDLGTGILQNRTHGGDGGLGGSKKGRTCSDHRRKKLAEAGKGRTHTAETKQKISKSHTGKIRAPFSEEWRENMSKNHKGTRGFSHSDETKKRLSEHFSKPIFCVTNNTWYPSRRAACDELNLKVGNVGHCLHGYQKSTGGYQFSYYS